MFWTITAIAAGVAVLAALAIVAVGRRARGRISTSGQAAAADSHTSPYGLTTEDAARLRRSARDQMRRHQAQWSRDYLSGVTDGALPGRVAGIPRSLRVRR